MQVKVKALGAVRVSPDGKRVVYTVNEAVMTADKSEFVTQIWTGERRRRQIRVQITFGDKSSTNPKWSPDGNWIAFTSNRKDNKNNLYLLRMNGGEAEPMTDVKSERGGFRMVARRALDCLRDDRRRKAKTRRKTTRDATIFAGSTKT